MRYQYHGFTRRVFTTQWAQVSANWTDTTCIMRKTKKNQKGYNLSNELISKRLEAKLNMWGPFKQFALLLGFVALLQQIRRFSITWHPPAGNLVECGSRAWSSSRLLLDRCRLLQLRWIVTIIQIETTFIPARCRFPSSELVGKLYNFCKHGCSTGILVPPRVWSFLRNAESPQQKLNSWCLLIPKKILKNPDGD